MASNRTSGRNEAGRISPKSDTALPLSRVLRDAREKRHLTQKTLAQKLGMRQRQISDLERGAVDSRLSTILNVARALDLELILIPRPLIATVEGLQRAGSDTAQRPMYSLDDEPEFVPGDEPHDELGSASRPGVIMRQPRRSKEPQ